MKHKLVVYHLFCSAVILATIKFYQADEIENVEALWEEFKLVNAKAYGNLEEEFNRLKLKYCQSPTLLIRNIILFTKGIKYGLATITTFKNIIKTFNRVAMDLL